MLHLVWAKSRLADARMLVELLGAPTSDLEIKRHMQVLRLALSDRRQNKLAAVVSSSSWRSRRTPPRWAEEQGDGDADSVAADGDAFGYAGLTRARFPTKNVEERCAYLCR